MQAFTATYNIILIAEDTGVSWFQKWLVSCALQNQTCLPVDQFMHQATDNKAGTHSQEAPAQGAAFVWL